MPARKKKWTGIWEPVDPPRHMCYHKSWDSYWCGPCQSWCDLRNAEDTHLNCDLHKDNVVPDKIAKSLPFKLPNDSESASPLNEIQGIMVNEDWKQYPARSLCTMLHRVLCSYSNSLHSKRPRQQSKQAVLSPRGWFVSGLRACFSGVSFEGWFGSNCVGGRLGHLTKGRRIPPLVRGPKRSSKTL